MYKKRKYPRDSYGWFFMTWWGLRSYVKWGIDIEINEHEC